MHTITKRIILVINST